MMGRRMRSPAGALVLVALLLAGCGQLPVAGLGGEDGQVIGLLQDSQRFGGLGAEAQRRELTAAAQAHARERSARSRLRLALLLAAPATPVADDARALSLLDPLAEFGPASSPLRQLAALLQAQVADRVREGRRATQMKEQIDALRAIERNLMDRGSGRTR